MTEDQAVGMFVGLFVGDALGAPLEFINPADIKDTHDCMTGGGVHNTSRGEWTDDGAMALAIAQAYVDNKGKYNPCSIVTNFKDWKQSGKFGTRDYVFDIGATCSSAIQRMTVLHPYAGGADEYDSGNGSVMRLAPIVIANKHDFGRAVAQSTAVSLMTHGSSSVVDYTAQFVHDLFYGDIPAKTSPLRYKPRAIESGSIMHTCNMAWSSIETFGDFETILIEAVNYGRDADTVGAVTGMLAGRIYGYKAIPKRWLKPLHQHDKLVRIAKELYALNG